MDQLHSDYHLIWFSQPKEAQNYNNQLGGGDSRPPFHPTESSQSKPSRSNSPTPRGLPNIISRDTIIRSEIHNNQLGEEVVGQNINNMLWQQQRSAVKAVTI